MWLFILCDSNLCFVINPFPQSSQWNLLSESAICISSMWTLMFLITTPQTGQGEAVWTFFLWAFTSDSFANCFPQSGQGIGFDACFVTVCCLRLDLVSAVNPHKSQMNVRLCFSLCSSKFSVVSKLWIHWVQPNQHSFHMSFLQDKVFAHSLLVRSYNQFRHIGTFADKVLDLVLQLMS